MKYSFILPGLFSTAAAIPTALEKQSPMQSRPLALSKNGDKAVSTTSPNWSGIVQSGNGFNHITGTFIIPSVSGPKGSGAAFWVGFDGVGSCGSLMQAGVAADSDGTTFAWYEWYSQPSYKYDLAVKPGDVIRVTVDASSTTGGSTTTENLTTGKSASHTFTDGPGPLCEKTAEWIVEAYAKGSNIITLANYGSVTFTNAAASGPGGAVSGEGGDTYDLKQDGKIVSQCSGANGDIACQYQG